MTGTSAATVFVAVASGLVGLAFGSFFNVVIYRLPRRMSLSRPASHCPGCANPISSLDNIPLVSWLVLRGHCRHCKMAISARYPLVELLTALVFAAVAVCTGPHGALIPIDVALAGALIASAIGIDGQAVPASLVVATAGGPVGLAILALVSSSPGRLGWAAAAAAVAALGGFIDERPTSRRADFGVLVSLAWCAGWCWPPGGFGAAGWILLSASVIRFAPTTSHAARVRVAVLSVGATGMLLASAAVGVR
jgi:Bacterial Peptidase A24 N-terminal domain